MKNNLLTVLFILISSVVFSQFGEIKMLHTIKHSDLNPAPDAGSKFGDAVVSLGDLNQDGTEDIAVGAPFQGSGGRVYIIFLNQNGSVKSHKVIGTGLNGFTGTLGSNDGFGFSLANLGDISGDGTIELAIGSPFLTNQSVDDGAVWILSIDTSGMVSSHLKISSKTNGFNRSLDGGEGFGRSLSFFPDANGNGIPELLVGSSKDTISNNAGRVYLLSLNPSGQVSKVKFYDRSNTYIQGGTNYNFSTSLSYLEDIDSNGVSEILVGTPGDDVSYTNSGSIWVLFLDTNLNIIDTLRYHNETPNYSKNNDSISWLGQSLTNLGDVDGDGNVDIALGSSLGMNYADSTERVRMLFLNNDASIKSGKFLKAEFPTSPFMGITSITDFDSDALAALSDLNGDGRRDLAVGTSSFDVSKGQVHLITLNGSVQISLPETNLPKQELNIYPQPSKGVINLKLPKNWNGQPITVIVYDLAGQKIIGRQEYPSLNGEISLKLNLPDGTYLMEASNGQEKATGKVVIQKKP